MREYSGREVLICAWVGSGISVLGCGQRRLHNWEQGAGTGEAGAAEIGLDAEAGSEKHSWMPRRRLRGAASIPDPIRTVGLMDGAEQAGSQQHEENVGLGGVSGSGKWSLGLRQTQQPEAPRGRPGTKGGVM